MINVFIGALIVQALFGFAFKTYLWIKYNAQIVYSSSFNCVFTLLVIGLIGAYAYALNNHKKSLTKFQKMLTTHLRYTFILNVIAILLAQICLLYTNQAYLYLNPENPRVLIRKLENDIHVLEGKLTPLEIDVRIEQLEQNIEWLESKSQREEESKTSKKRKK